MAIAVICTGTELLRGTTVNTNSAFLGRCLVSAGSELELQLSIGDRPKELFDALADALRSADTLIVSGGLGPTDDDITLECVARFFGKKLALSPELEEKVREHYRAYHRDGSRCPKRQFKQALLPESGHIIPNPAGSASGIWFDTEYAGVVRRIFLAPGPPREFEPMAEKFIVPLAVEREKHLRYTQGLLIAGIGESTVMAEAEKLLIDFGGEVADTASGEGTTIYLSGEENPVRKSIRELCGHFGVSALPPGQTKLFPYFSQLMKQRKLSFACAESCTGGLIAEKITELPGASEFFLGGVVSYCNELKEKLLGVRHETLVQFGAVSGECVKEMVEGVCRTTGADCGVAVSGIAGPDGGTPDKPVGLVWIAMHTPGKTECRELHLRGSRQMIRDRAAALAINALREMLEQ